MILLNKQLWDVPLNEAGVQVCEQVNWPVIMQVYRQVDVPVDDQIIEPVIGEIL